MRRYELIPDGYGRWSLKAWTLDGVLVRRTFHASASAAFDEIFASEAEWRREVERLYTELTEVKE